MKATRRAHAKNVVGTRVRTARLNAIPAISQEDLAGRLAAQGVTLDQGALSRIERGERYVLDYEAQAMARCLRVRVGWLFGEE